MGSAGKRPSLWGQGGLCVRSVSEPQRQPFRLAGEGAAEAAGSNGWKGGWGWWLLHPRAHAGGVPLRLGFGSRQQTALLPGNHETLASSLGSVAGPRSPHLYNEGVGPDCLMALSSPDFAFQQGLQVCATTDAVT